MGTKRVNGFDPSFDRVCVSSWKLISNCNGNNSLHQLFIRNTSFSLTKCNILRLILSKCKSLLETIIQRFSCSFQHVQLYGYVISWSTSRFHIS